ncbi:hypothetical protein BHM03_00060762 [Ensete ventricosum]|nr:hypothetical protein BHM03_00060762 [Ensete ventricosum]
MALGRNKSDSQICYLVHLGAASAMEDLKAALTEHVDLTSELFEKFAAELRSGFGPAVDKYYVHAIDWKVRPLAKYSHISVTDLTSCTLLFCFSFIEFEGTM